VKNANLVFSPFLGHTSHKSRYHRLYFSTWIAALLIGVVLTGCRASQSPTDAATSVKTVNDHFDILVGKKIVHMQLAILPSECERGLMQRPHLNQDEGMIFLFDRPQQLQFWMHNTQIPLTIGYFTPEGKLAEIYSMYAFDERTVSSLSKNLQFALEMAENWYSDHDVTAGDMLDVHALSCAVKARGFKPSLYGLPNE
jgi:uncharacterized protein